MWIGRARPRLPLLPGGQKTQLGHLRRSDSKEPDCVSFDFFFIDKFVRLYILYIYKINFIGASPSGKAAVFGTAIRRFESFRPRKKALKNAFVYD
jgi:hypothetical protein